MSKRDSTPSFVVTLPLSTTPDEEAMLEARLEAARQLYNACLGEAIKRMRLVRESKAYRLARKLPKGGNERTRAFSEARRAHEFSDSALQRYAIGCRRSWIGEHLDAHTAQKLATRAFRAAEKVLVGKARKVRFKGRTQLDTVEGKSNEAGIRWRQDRVEWSGLVLRAILDTEDVVVARGLMSRVKYVRLVRRRIKGQARYFAQLVCEGKPLGQRKLGEGAVGLDLGPSTVASVGEREARLDQFCEGLKSKEDEIRGLQRQIDRQRRAANPANYNADGTIKRGNKTWTKSKRQQAAEAELAEVHRRTAEHRRRLHGHLLNIILLLGSVFFLEKVSYRAWQRRFGRSVGKRAPGRFVSELRRVAESAGGAVHEIPTRSTKLSQTCQCGRVRKKRLSERWHRCECGVEAQRDLYSAFLAAHVDPALKLLDADKAVEAWPGAQPLLRAAFEQTSQRASGGPLPSSFGASRRQSASPAKEEGAETKARDAVGPPKGAIREPGRGQGMHSVLLRTPRL